MNRNFVSMDMFQQDLRNINDILEEVKNEKKMNLVQERLFERYINELDESLKDAQKMVSMKSKVDIARSTYNVYKKTYSKS